MAEDKRANPYPHLTAAEFHAAPGTREQKAARCIAARKFGGIPTRGFLVGSNDHSPVMQGLTEFTEAVYRLLDHVEDGPSPVSPEIEMTAQAVRQIMEDHGCPSESTTEQ